MPSFFSFYVVSHPSSCVLNFPAPASLDPSTRSSIWALVNSFATQDRSIIITTHTMIEADTLCDRIAIVSRGRLKVVGTQQHLKNKFGSGYLLQLNLLKSSPENQASAMGFVQKYLHPEAVLGTKQAKTLHIILPRDLNLQKVFSALYSPECETEGRINQFLLSQSSLEDVFVSLGFVGYGIELQQVVDMIVNTCNYFKN
jgi:ABC-type multidrug transport system ATPase subunit